MRCKVLFTLIMFIAFLCSGCQSNSDPHEEAKDTSLEQQDVIYENEESAMESEPGNMGEGVPVPVEVDLEEGDIFQPKDRIVIGTEGSELYELVIEEVVYTDQRDEYVQDPGNVILVTYTYKNLSEKAVFIDDMSFQMIGSDENTILEPYYLADIQVPEPIEKDSSCTAQLAFSSAEKIDSVMLVYHDIVNTEVSPVKIAVNNLQ